MLANNRLSRYCCSCKNRSLPAAVVVVSFGFLTLLFVISYKFASDYYMAQLDSQHVPMTYRAVVSMRSTSSNWIELLKQSSEAVWLESKRRRIASIQAYSSDFRRNPWIPHSLPFASVFWNFFSPAYDCPWPVQRVGEMKDGGKFVCGFAHISQKPSCVVYSYGISTEVSYETEILELTNCSVYMYDHTIDPGVGAPAKLVSSYPGRAVLYKLGLGVTNTGPLRTLQTEMKKHGHEFIDLLKIDIEGPEIEILPSIVLDFPALLPFGQLQVEIHVLFGGDPFSKMVEWFELLERAGLRAFRCETNVISIYDANINYANVMEYAFLNSKLNFTSYFLE